MKASSEIESPDMKDVRSRVHAAFEEAIGAGQTVRKRWLVHSFMTTLAPAEGDEADFYRVCGYYAVNDLVSRELRAAKEQELEEASAQTSFAGFEHIQRRYSIERDGEPCIVPTEEMSPRELREKATELRAHARGTLEHADELDRLAQLREEAASPRRRSR